VIRVQFATWVMERVCRRIARVWRRPALALARAVTWWACRSLRGDAYGEDRRKAEHLTRAEAEYRVAKLGDGWRVRRVER